MHHQSDHNSLGTLFLELKQFIYELKMLEYI
jgi:hypothetical protein